MEHMRRPEISVLPDSAVVPTENLVQPPKELSHEVIVEQPFYYEIPKHGESPVGKFRAGTKLWMLTEEVKPGFSKVVTSQGLCVLTRSEGLLPLTSR
jgi:hypothetical protein